MTFLTISNVHFLVSHFQLLFSILLTELTKNICFCGNHRTNLFSKALREVLRPDEASMHSHTLCR